MKSIILEFTPALFTFILLSLHSWNIFNRYHPQIFSVILRTIRGRRCGSVLKMRTLLLGEAMSPEHSFDVIAAPPEEGMAQY
jgi:hypothetical protein